MRGNPGILIEKMSPLKLFINSWKIIQEWKLENYFERSEQLSTAWEVLNNYCISMKDCIVKKKLKLLHIHLKKTSNKASDIEKSLIDEIPEGKSRKKRGVISYTLKNLLNLADEEDIKMLNKILEEEVAHREKLSNSMSVQLQFFQNEFGKLIEETRDLNNFTLLFDQQMQGAANQSMLASGEHLLTEAIQQFKYDTLLLESAISSAEMGKMHGDMLTLEKLNSSISTAKKKFADVDFPSLRDVYKISNFGVYFFNKSLYYYVSVPMIKNENYTLYKATPVPVRQQGPNATNTNGISLQPENTYFGLKDNLESYVPMNQEVLDKCKNLRSTRICKSRHPSRSVNKDSPCEVLISSKKNITDYRSCKLSTENLTSSYWEPTSFDNEWVYSTVNKKNLTIKCENSSKPQYNETIDGMGKLFLPPGCTAFTNDTYLEAEKEIVTRLDPEILEQYRINMTEFFQEVKNGREARLRKMVNETNPKSYSSQFLTPEGKIMYNKIVNDTSESGKRLELQKKSDDFVAAAISSITSVLIILVAIIVFCKLRSKNGCSCFGKPQPTASTVINITREPSLDELISKLSKSQDLLIQ